MEKKSYEHISLERARALAAAILAKAQYSDEHASSMIQNMIDAQAQECHSHGLYRLLDCYNAAKSGQINLTAQPVVTDHAASVVKVDALQGNSLLAFEKGLVLLAEKARANGIAAMAINNTFHYSALWWEVEKISDLGLVGLAMSPFLERYEAAYRAEMQYFLRGVLENTPFSPGITDGLRAQLLADAATQSLQQGGAISVA